MSPNLTNERQLTRETEKTFSVLLNVRLLTESKTEKPDIVFSVPNTTLNSRGISVCCILVENVE